MTIGVLCDNLVLWGGGRDLVRWWLSVLGAPNGVDLERDVRLIVSHDGRGVSAEWFERTRQIRNRLFSLGNKPRSNIGAVIETDIENIRSAANAAMPTVTYRGGAGGLSHAATMCRVDVLFAAINPLPQRFSIPYVGYIPDCQHRYLKRHFRWWQIAERDHVFRLLVRRSGSMVLNSAAVAKDAVGYYNASPERVTVLPFAPTPRIIAQEKVREVREKYTIRLPYYIICNQLWLHKDHKTAIRAFAAYVHTTREDVHLICTGSTEDPRCKGLYCEILDLIAASGVGARVRFLGHIPKDDQLALMKGAKAVLQPSLFEGGPGGGQVYDAAGMGVQCLVSDIAVNREINWPGVSFFRAGNDVSLLNEMMRICSAAPVTDADLAIECERLRQEACSRMLRACRAAMTAAQPQTLRRS